MQSQLINAGSIHTQYRQYRVGRQRLPALLRCALAALALGAMIHVPTAQADDERDAGDPVNRVARVSYLKGDVSVAMPGADEHDSGAERWQSARINLPLVPGDALSTDGNARAELQMGDTTLQIDEETQLTLDVLDDDHIRVLLDQGSVFLRVRSEDDAVEVQTRNGSVRVNHAGRYRITSWNDDVMQVQVRDGDADVLGERQTYPVHEGEQLTLRGTRRVSVDYDDLPRMDDFDRWADARNDRASRGVTTRYVSSEVIGYEDLDDHGYWRYEADYGYVWSPTTVVVNWAPYRYGHWAWIAPWGWTWVDDAPWGFAPFHYGRWARLHNRWCWVPGPRTVRPVYAPALVAWMGTPGVSITVSSGPRVGWIPLGPRDIYRPWYRHSALYARTVNLSSGRMNERDFDRGWRRQPHETNYGNRAAATVVAASAFQRGDLVQRHLMKPHGNAFAVSDQAPQRPLPNSAREAGNRDGATHGRPFWNRGAGSADSDSRFHRAPPRDAVGNNAPSSGTTGGGTSDGPRVWRDPRNQQRPQPAPDAASPAPTPTSPSTIRPDNERRSWTDRGNSSPREPRTTSPRPETPADAPRNVAPAASPPSGNPEPRIWRRAPEPGATLDRGRGADQPAVSAPRQNQDSGWRDNRSFMERSVAPAPRAMPQPAPQRQHSEPRSMSPGTSSNQGDSPRNWRRESRNESTR